MFRPAGGNADDLYDQQGASWRLLRRWNQVFQRRPCTEGAARRKQTLWNERLSWARSTPANRVHRTGCFMREPKKTRDPNAAWLVVGSPRHSPIGLAGGLSLSRHGLSWGGPNRFGTGRRRSQCAWHTWPEFSRCGRLTRAIALRQQGSIGSSGFMPVQPHAPAIQVRHRIFHRAPDHIHGDQGRCNESWG